MPGNINSRYCYFDGLIELFEYFKIPDDWFTITLVPVG
jgi:hypothetical protein